MVVVLLVALLSAVVGCCDFLVLVWDFFTDGIIDMQMDMDNLRGGKYPPTLGCDLH